MAARARLLLLVLPLLVVAGEAASDHSAGAVVATRPAFLLGLALQVPFALVAFAAARLLLGLAAAIVEARAGSRAGPIAAWTPAARRPVDRGACLARPAPSLRATRAPPPAPAY